MQMERRMTMENRSGQAAVEIVSSVDTTIGRGIIDVQRPRHNGTFLFQLQQWSRNRAELFLRPSRTVGRSDTGGKGLL